MTTSETRINAFKDVLKKPVLAVSILIVFAIVASVFLASLIAPYDPLQQDLLNALQPPSAQHLFGTDGLGRDIFSRMLFGGQPTLVGVAIALAVFVILGVILGIVAGYIGGLTDRVISAIIDMLLSLPGFVLMLAILAIFQNNMNAAMVLLGVLASVNLARIVRAEVIKTREELFVSAAVVSGLNSARIMARHILPSLVGPTLVQMSLFSGIALAVQTGLGYLGLGTPPPEPSWGALVGEASIVMSSSPWFLLITGGCISLMTLTLGLIGDGLRDANAEQKGRFARRARKSNNSSRVASTQSDPGALLELKNLQVTFDVPKGKSVAVQDVSFKIQKGEIFGLVGESGSGKSVTAFALLGLLPQNGLISDGHAWFDGFDLAAATEKDFKKLRGSQIALISQEPMMALDPSFTVGNLLAEVIAKHSKMSKAQIKERSIELLKSVQLKNPEELLGKYAHELSGGMAQRVAIALALSGSPKLLIADEPTTALDVTVQATILDLLRSLRDDLGMTVILVTHDLGVVADICDSAAVMSEGRILERGTVDEIFYNPQSDYTKRLIASTPNLVKEI